MKPYYQDNHVTQYCMDFRENDLPDESVQCVVTSPPYWGLRKYSGEQDLIWGDTHCEHEWGAVMTTYRTAYESKTKWQHVAGDSKDTNEIYERSPGTFRHNVGQGNFCSLCGAWKGGYGLEPTPELYVQHTIEILREIRRVLRKDGVVFWNIGDSYYGSGQGAWDNPSDAVKEVYIPKVGELPKKESRTLKPKDICLIPFRVAIAAQDDGWWVRSVIIWSKPNPMPESVADRPTESHEYILMLTKSARYYWDADAVREAQTGNAHSRGTEIGNEAYQEARGSYHGFKSPELNLPAGRNIRTVWEFPTQPYPEAHFAVFPEKLPEICIKAATPEVGCCSKCGSPWERIVESKQYPRHDTEPHDLATDGDGANKGKHAKPTETKTIGWQPTCKCNSIKPPVPSIVLDPFSGAGTTLWVAKKLNRKAVGFDISEEYCELIKKRNRQQVMI